MKIFIKKLIKCSSNYIPIHIIPNILNGEDIDIVIYEIINNKDNENLILKERHMNQLRN